MLLYPKKYLNSVKEITIEFMNENCLKGIILDVDNTLVDYYKQIPKGIKEWAALMKQNSFKLFIVSNSNNTKKVESIAKALGVEYINLAFKPFKRGFLKAAKKMNLEPVEIAVVGDQIFTDVLGANRSKMFSILVKPLNEKDLFITRFNRTMEKRIIKKIEKNEVK